VEYVVQPGDTVSDMAEQFGISVNTILWANNLSVLSTLRPGQKLQILPVSGVIHKVAKNDTVEKIATKYKSDKDKILAFNPELAGGALTVGQTIVVPDGILPLAPRPAAPARAPIIAPANVVPGVEMLWPVPVHRITQYFKWNHAAIDIGLPTGSSVWASDDGIIEYSGWSRGGWGNTIVVNHGDGRKTRYSHLSKVLVAVGDTVTKGQNIALSGNTGRSTGPHLDYRIYINGRTVNPLYYIK
jgi:murein DD-endopeptidase MepM/ murein hydrolase activator NlpD